MSKALERAAKHVLSLASTAALTPEQVDGDYELSEVRFAEWKAIRELRAYLRECAGLDV